MNLRLGWQVWDYSSQPGNVLGQVCPLFCFLWLMLSLPVLLLCGWLRHHMEPELLFDVPPEKFLPAPKVTSSVIRCVSFARRCDRMKKSPKAKEERL